MKDTLNRTFVGCNVDIIITVYYIIHHLRLADHVVFQLHRAHFHYISNPLLLYNYNTDPHVI